MGNSVAGGPVIVEQPIRFGRVNGLVGVLATPGAGAAPADAPAALFLNAGILHRVGPNRLYVTLARMLARAGVSSLRFDLSGIGDSVAPRDEHGSLEELVQRDVEDALEVAARYGANGKVVLIGLCSGADYALRAAVRDVRVAGAILLDPDVHRTRGFYLRHYAKALLSLRSWRLALMGEHPTLARIARRLGIQLRSLRGAPQPFLAPTVLPPRAQMRDQLHALVQRGSGLFYVFTGGLPYRYNHEKQFARTFPDLPFGAGVEVRYYPKWDHTFSDPNAQQELGDRVRRWFEGLAAAARAREVEPSRRA